MIEGAMARHAIQKPSELELIIPIVEAIRPQLILEIGTARGGTAWLWSCLAYEVITVDKIIEYEQDDLVPNIHPLCADSHLYSTVDYVMRTMAQLRPHVSAVDMLFIDGDHSVGGVTNDYLWYSRLVRPGGLVCFHDICDHPHVDPSVGVSALWRSLRELYPHDELISGDPAWGGIGVLYL